METKTTPIPIPPAEDLVEVKKPTSLLVAQFFLFPLIIIAICVGIFLLFGYLTYEQRGPNEYLSDIRNGSGSTRWLAAVELSNQISSGNKLRNPDFVRNAISVYTGARDDDPRVRRFLALTLGKLGDKQAVAPLVQGLQDAEDLKNNPEESGGAVFSSSVADRHEAQVQNQIYTLWALGSIGDNAAVPGVLKMLRSDDPAVRKTAAYVLGALKDPSAVHDLQVALNDPKDDVRWNAAMALARLGDASGADVLVTLTDRGYLQKYDDIAAEQKSELMVNAVKCLGILKFEPARNKITELSQSDPDLAVRDASIEALKKF